MNIDGHIRVYLTFIILFHLTSEPTFLPKHGAVRMSNKSSYSTSEGFELGSSMCHAGAKTITYEGLLSLIEDQ